MNIKTKKTGTYIISIYLQVQLGFFIQFSMPSFYSKEWEKFDKPKNRNLECIYSPKRQLP